MTCYFKNYLKFGILFLGILLFNNCAEDTNEEIIEQVENDNLSDNPVVKMLISMGYKLEQIQELDDYYLVQGDLLFSKDINDYNRKKSSHETSHFERHAHTDDLVSQINATTMTVYVDPSIPTSGTDNWRNAISNSISDLNGINGSKVTFIFSTNTNSDITIESDNNSLPNNVIASAGFPTNDQPFNTVLINLDYSSNTNVSESNKRYNMVHELGHCIGLRHTNWENVDSVTNVGANLIPGTPSQDPNSVMNGGTATFSWSGFSNFDIIAIEYLYPALTINGSSLICVNETKTYTLANGGASVIWQVPSYIQIVSSTNTSVTVTFTNSTTNGPAYIRANTGNGTVQKDFWIGKRYVDWVDFTNDIGEEGYFCSSHNGNEYVISPKIKGNTYQYRLLSFPSLSVLYTSTTTSSNSGTINYTPSPGWYVFEVRITNACGTSQWIGNEVEYVDCINGGGGQGDQGEG